MKREIVFIIRTIFLNLRTVQGGTGLLCKGNLGEGFCALALGRLSWGRTLALPPPAVWFSQVS